MCRNNRGTKFFSYVLAIGILITTPLYGNTTEVKAEESFQLPEHLYVCGSPIGMRLEADGLMVTGYNSFLSENDEYVNPAKEAGVQIGDRIVESNGNKIGGGEELAAVLAEYDVDEATAAADLDELLQKLNDMGVLDNQ